MALNSACGVNFFLHNLADAFFALGAVALAVIGTGALYADMGHFGKRPIQLAWFNFVLPALVLNYFGQRALPRRTRLNGSRTSRHRQGRRGSGVPSP